jgi:putative ubiquitin-RnfH superfamily antitoxin RatB of RatAB toxin-antitoxin module
MAPAEGGALLQVSVAFSPEAGVVDEVALALPPGSTVGDALAASGLPVRHPQLDPAALTVGIWGALCERSQPLRDRDRVELYRPLRVDPKEARRRRHTLQRAARAGPVKPSR